MRHSHQPYVGKWYINHDLNNTFEVVASDDDSVEIQYFAGEIEGLDLDTWYDLDLKQIPAPEDWSGPFELSYHDMGYSYETLRPEDWSGPLAELEPDDDY